MPFTRREVGPIVITREMAQPIVDRLQQVMDDPVSIIDHEGRVVASADAARIGSFHAGAVEALRTRKDLFVYAWQQHKLPGTRTGITMPLEFHGEWVGAVGIAGDPDELKAAAALINVAVLALIEQAHLTRQANYRRRMLDIWVASLTADRVDDWAHLKQQAAFLGIDTGKCCALLVVSTRPAACNEFSVNEEFVYSVVQSHVQVHFYAYVGQGQYALAVRARSKAEVAALQPMCEELLSRMAALNRQCHIGLGKPARGLAGYRQSYQSAAHSVRIIQRLGREKPVIFYYEHQIFRLLESVPEEALAGFLDSTLEGKRLDPLLRQTLEAYFELDKGIGETAAALHIHRNTLIFRLNKVRDLYGLDPRAFRDSVALQLLLYTLKFPLGGQNGPGTHNPPAQKEVPL